MREKIAYKPQLTGYKPDLYRKQSLSVIPLMEWESEWRELNPLPLGPEPSVLPMNYIPYAALL